MSDNLTRRAILDPGTATMLTEMERKAEERNIPKKERERKAREREKLAARNRVMIDLPEDINGRIVAIAAEQGVSVSSVIALACWLLIGEDIDWTDYKEPSSSPRFGWRVVIPPIVREE